MNGLSRTTVYRSMAEGHFPRQVSLGVRAVGWKESDIEKWLNEREVTIFAERSAA